jgi:hypothetical protein
LARYAFVSNLKNDRIEIEQLTATINRLSDQQLDRLKLVPDTPRMEGNPQILDSGNVIGDLEKLIKIKEEQVISLGAQIDKLESSANAENGELKSIIEALQNEVQLKSSDMANQEDHISQLECKVLQLEEMSDQTAFRELEQVVASLRRHVAKRDRTAVQHTKAISELKKVIVEREPRDILAGKPEKEISVIPGLERKIEK